MAGHSKWANIKHRKERSDVKKGKIFSRIAKEIISAVKVGGVDTKGNTRLRMAIQKAKEANVPNEIVERNIKKASSADQADYFELSYELYGYGGVGIIVDIMTDNKNRISSDMRIATNKRGGNVAAPGSVMFNFDRKGVIQVPKESISEDELFLVAIEAGAEDYEVADDLYLVFTDPTALYNVKEAMVKLGINCGEADFDMIPKTYVDCNEEATKSNLALIEWIDALDDVDCVYHNMNDNEFANN